MYMIALIEALYLLRERYDKHTDDMRPQEKAQTAAAELRSRQGVRGLEKIDGGRTPAGVLRNSSPVYAGKGGLYGFYSELSRFINNFVISEKMYNTVNTDNSGNIENTGKASSFSVVSWLQSSRPAAR